MEATSGKRARLGEHAGSEADKQEAFAGVLEINVGGRVFTTTDSTLKKSPLLRTMLEHLQAGSMTTTLDKESRIFLDRSPNAFEHILQYLRSGRWSIPFGS